MAMVCLQETAIVSVEIAWFRYRQDAAACVSLSKSTMSKTRLEASSPADNARRREERRLYPHPDSLSIASVLITSCLEKSAKLAPGPLRGLPHSVRCESIEGAENSSDPLENQEPKLSFSSCPAQKLRPQASGGVYGCGRSDASLFWFRI